MKNALLVAAGLLLGTTSAGVHKMKLKKVDLTEQLVCLMATRIKAPILDILNSLRDGHDVANMVTYVLLRNVQTSILKYERSAKNIWALDLNVMARRCSEIR